MKAQSTALAAHRAGGTTTLAYCWLVTRLYGAVYTFTSHSQDIIYSGRTYLAAPGFTPTAMAGSADLAVTNLEVIGPINTATISEDDVMAGRWDHASVEVFEVNYNDLSMGRMLLSSGTLGHISTGKNEFKAEQRGIEQLLQQPVGRVYAPGCDATVGDARCGINLPAITENGTVVASNTQRVFSSTGVTQMIDWFGGGVVTWLTGANAGLRMEVQNSNAGDFQLVLAMPYVIATGDTFTASPGCRKNFNVCRAKYSNVINYRGFPFLPGNDKTLGNGGITSA